MAVEVCNSGIGPTGTVARNSLLTSQPRRGVILGVKVVSAFGISAWFWIELAAGIKKVQAIETVRNLRALAITETELKLIAKAAIIGESRIPKVEYKAPAAMGIPIQL